MKQFGLISALFLMISSVFAANPVLYTLDVPFPAEISTLGGSITATYTFTNNLPWTFTKPFRVNAKLCPNSPCTALPADFSYDDQCSGKKLKPNERCTYKLTLSAKSPGQKTLLVSYGGYDKNVVELKPLTTMAIAKPAGVFGTTDLPTATPLPSNTFPSTNYTLTFTFTNYSASAIRFTQRITQNNNPSHPNFTITSNTCAPSGTTGTLAKGKQCIIKGKFTSATNGKFTLSAQLIGALSSNKVVTSTTVQSPSFNKLI